MNFELSETHREIADAARRVATDKLAPLAETIDTEGRVPASLLEELGELGLIGVAFPESAGGVGLDALAYALVIEALAEGSPSVARVVAAAAGPGAMGLVAAGLATEAHAGGSVLSTYSSGELAPLLEGPFVRDDEVFEAADGAPLDTLGHRGARLAHLEPRGEKLASVSTEPLRAWRDLGLAALALGSGRGAFRAGVAYALERKQFGRPIAQFQAIQWKIADSSLALDTAELLVRRAALSLDPRDAVIARVQAGRAAFLSADHALQIHGGYGYTREYPVERHLRSARMCAGTDAHMALV